jgi:hypothetical protein
MSSATPQPGQIVAVRQRLYLVEESVPAVNPSDSALVRLSCVDDDAQGQALEVLWDHELDAQAVTGEAWETIASRGFDQPILIERYPEQFLKVMLGVSLTRRSPLKVMTQKGHNSEGLPLF